MEDRTRFIGASEVSAVMGLNPFMTPLKLWAIKRGEIQPDNLDENEAVEWGTRLERIVSQKFSEKHNVKLIARKTRYVHPDHEWLSCELDNIVALTDELVEIKTVNAWAWKSWENPDELPAYVIVQVMMQLGLSNRKVGWVACLCGGQKYIEKRIDFDKMFYENLVSRCVAFWVMVKDGVAPAPIAGDSDTLLDLHPKSNDAIQLVQDLETAVARRQELSGQIDDLKEEKELLEVKIKAVIGDNLGIKTERYLVTWKEQARQVVDVDAIKRDGVYEGYTKESKTRVLRIANNKEKGK